MKVESKPDPSHIAYSGVELPLHNDFVYIDHTCGVWYSLSFYSKCLLADKEITCNTKILYMLLPDSDASLYSSSTGSN